MSVRTVDRAGGSSMQPLEGITVVDGEMVDEPVLVRARHILDLSARDARTDNQAKD